LGQVHGNGPNWDLCHYDPDPAAKNGSDLFQADAKTIGIDRTLCSGRVVLEQYPPILREMFNKPDTCPEKYLLWFHRLPWEYRLKDGRKLSEAIDHSYWSNVRAVEDFICAWQTLEPHIEKAIYKHILEKLHAQHAHALKWARHMTGYFNRLRQNK
jgi:alpha-glucuronidase